MTACTITHIAAETVRYGGAMALRFCTENEVQRKLKPSIKVNRRHVTKTLACDTSAPLCVIAHKTFRVRYQNSSVYLRL